MPHNTVNRLDSFTGGYSCKQSPPLNQYCLTFANTGSCTQFRGCGNTFLDNSPHLKWGYCSVRNTLIASSLIGLVFTCEAQVPWTRSTHTIPNETQSGFIQDWKPDNVPRNDDADSPYIPKGYKRAFTENFLDDKMVFGRTGNPKFTTGNFRLDPNDLNTCRRLATTGERELFFDKDFSCNGVAFNINPFSIKDGILSISANPLSETNRKTLAPLENKKKNLKAVLYSSGMLSTETQLRKPGEGFDQLYGYWELRARMPKGKGLWPAFWLVNENWNYWNEIDIFEVLGDEPLNIYQSTHFKDGGGTDGMSWPQHTYKGINPTDGFHLYGLLMTVDKLYFYVDGVQTLKVSHKLHDPFYTIISLAVGGDWPKDPDQTTKFPASFDVDYLRIYQKAE